MARASLPVAAALLKSGAATSLVNGQGEVRFWVACRSLVFHHLTHAPADTAASGLPVRQTLPGEAATAVGCGRHPDGPHRQPAAVPGSWTGRPGCGRFGLGWWRPLNSFSGGAAASIRRWWGPCRREPVLGTPLSPWFSSIAHVHLSCTDRRQGSRAPRSLRTGPIAQGLR